MRPDLTSSGFHTYLMGQKSTAMSSRYTLFCHSGCSFVIIRGYILINRLESITVSLFALFLHYLKSETHKTLSL